MMYYGDIIPCDLLNGSGFRCTIWVSGCSMSCDGCFNKKTHDRYYGKEYTKKTEKYLLDCLSKEYIDGVTITGGHPLEAYNLNDVLNLTDKIRILLPNKTIWLYTGFEFEYIYSNNDEVNKKRQEIISKCDVLVDGRYIESKRDISLKWRGSSNQRVINVQKSLKLGEIVTIE